MQREDTHMNKQPPIIEENQLTKSTSNLSHELFTLLVQQLPQAQLAINKAYEDKLLQELSDLVHKLQGTCVYCGLPRLNSALTALNQAIKQSQTDLSKYLQDFNYEVTAIMEELKSRGFK